MGGKGDLRILKRRCYINKGLWRICYSKISSTDIQEWLKFLMHRVGRMLPLPLVCTEASSAAACLCAVWLISHCVSSTDTGISISFNYQVLIGCHCHIGLLFQTVSSWLLLLWLLGSFYLIPAVGGGISIYSGMKPVTAKHCRPASSFFLLLIWNRIRSRW